MTGKRLLLRVLGWDFLDYQPSMHKKPHNSVTKRWSKRIRRSLNKELKIEINNYDKN